MYGLFHSPSLWGIAVRDQQALNYVACFGLQGSVADNVGVVFYQERPN